VKETRIGSLEEEEEREEEEKEEIESLRYALGAIGMET